ncbi:MAG: Intein-containing protein [Parcubacteria group bacterium GW2011_GWA2_45_15]|nr:MAG: Intein-containing protein [Parcubacteria group bacterium GW2011_GWA2_45_15]
MEQILNFQRALNIKVHIGKKSRGKGQEKKYFITQFSDVLFYQFLLSIGLTPAKSKTLGKVSIPSKYFFDFLRGCFDGDGYSYSYWDPRWRSSFMFYMGLVSASEDFIDWVRMEVRQRLGISGHIGKVKKISICYQLKYSKYEGIILVKALYKNNRGVFLKRKRLKIMKCLAIINKNLIKLVN